MDTLFQILSPRPAASRRSQVANFILVRFAIFVARVFYELSLCLAQRSLSAIHILSLVAIASPKPQVSLCGAFSLVQVFAGADTG